MLKGSLASRTETRSVPVRLEEEVSAAGRRGAEVETANDHSFTAGVLSLRGTCRKTVPLLLNIFFFYFLPETEALQYVSDLTPK